MEPAATLEEAFHRILENAYPDASLNELLAYAFEDDYGGRDTGDFPDGVSPYAAEGRFLYALVRALRPAVCLEIGCAVGGSATHILAALEQNQSGKLISFDLNPASGRLIPEYLRGRWELVVGDAREQPFPVADFVFEDSDHTYETTKTILTRVKALNPRCVLSHDTVLCATVRRAFDEVFPDGVVSTLLGTNFSSTGMACWLR